MVAGRSHALRGQSRRAEHPAALRGRRAVSQCVYSESRLLSVADRVSLRRCTVEIGRVAQRRPITSLAVVSRSLADVVDRSQSIRPEERPSVEDFDKSARHVSRLKIWMVVGVVTALVLTLSIWTTWKGPKEPTVESRNQSYRGVFTDDFMNGSGDQWERHLTTSAETEAFWEVENREFHIYTKDTVEMAALVATRRDIDVERLIDGRYTLKVSLDNLHTAAGCQFRWDPESHDGYGVAIGVAHDGEPGVALWKYDHWSMTALGTTTFMF